MEVSEIAQKKFSENPDSQEPYWRSQRLSGTLLEISEDIEKNLDPWLIPSILKPSHMRHLGALPSPETPLSLDARCSERPGASKEP